MALTLDLPAWRAKGFAAARLMRLDEPRDLVLLCLAGAWALWTASAGHVTFGTAFGYLIGAIALRCAAWIAIDLGDRRFLPAAGALPRLDGFGVRPAIRLLIGLCLLAVLAAAALDLLALLFVPLILGLILAYPVARARSYLSTLVLASAFACAAPMGWLVEGLPPGKIAWLFYLSQLFWAVALLLLLEAKEFPEIYRRQVRSLVQIRPDLLPVSVALLLAAMLTAAAMAAKQAGLGPLFELGWLGAVIAVVYQTIVLVRGGPDAAARAYDANLWLGVALWMGTVAHFICASTHHTPAIH